MVRKAKKAKAVRKARVLTDGLTSGDYEIGIQLSHRRPFRRGALRRLAYQPYPVAYTVVDYIGPAKRETADKIFERIAAAVRRAV